MSLFVQFLRLIFLFWSMVTHLFVEPLGKSCQQFLDLMEPSLAQVIFHSIAVQRKLVLITAIKMEHALMVNAFVLEQLH